MFCFFLKCHITNDILIWQLQKIKRRYFHFSWTQWRTEKTSREWWRASTSLSNSCCPLLRVGKWMTSILLKQRRRWRGTSPGASKPWQPERKDSWESLHRSWLLKVCPLPSFSPHLSSHLLTLYTKREGSDGCTRRGEQGHQGKEEDVEGRLIHVRDRYQISWTCMEGMIIILPSFPHRCLFSFFMISFSFSSSSSPCCNYRLILHTLNSSLNAGSHQHGTT